MVLSFILIQNRQGKTRLAKWYSPYNDEEKIKLKGEVHRLVAPRDQKHQSNFVEFRGSSKLIYRRYAGLFFCACVDANDNELAYLEAIHLFVEVLDQFFSNVCELDLVFNFYKVYAILDEMFLAGEIQETSKQVILTRLEHLDKLDSKTITETAIPKAGRTERERSLTDPHACTLRALSPRRDTLAVYANLDAPGIVGQETIRASSSLDFQTIKDSTNQARKSLRSISVGAEAMVDSDEDRDLLSGRRLKDIRANLRPGAPIHTKPGRMVAAEELYLYRRCNHIPLWRAPLNEKKDSSGGNSGGGIPGGTDPDAVEGEESVKSSSDEDLGEIVEPSEFI